LVALIGVFISVVDLAISFHPSVTFNEIDLGT